MLFYQILGTIGCLTAFVLYWLFFHFKAVDSILYSGKAYTWEAFFCLMLQVFAAFFSTLVLFDIWS